MEVTSIKYVPPVEKLASDKYVMSIHYEYRMSFWAAFVIIESKNKGGLNEK